MEIARLFGIAPHTLLRLPRSEFRKLAIYYKMAKEQMENTDGSSGFEPKPGDVIVE
jgi:hypothetical protein